MADRPTFLKRITINPKIMTGKPTIAGTRLTVQHILRLLAQGMTIEEVLTEHPGLTREDILAYLFFAEETLANTTFTTFLQVH